MREASNPRVQVGALGLVLVAFACLDTWLRAPGYASQGFASHDVAGITYNGMLLLRGELPYVDSVELKAPLTFYLAALVHGVKGGVGVESVASLIHLANAVATAALLGLIGMAARAWGLASAIIVGGVYVGFAGVLDSMDANYVTWANALAVFAMLAAWEGTRRERLGWWLVSGALCGLAAMAKRPVGVVFVVALLWGYLASGPKGERNWRIGGAVFAGAVVAHLPLGLHYLIKGEVGALVQGYLFNEWGGAYVGRRSFGLSEVGAEAVQASVHFLGAALALAGLGLLRSWRGAAGVERTTAMVFGIWAAFTLVAAAVGFRFYKGYFVPVLAPLALLAGHPEGIVGLAREARRQRVAALVLAVVLAASALLAARQATLYAGMRRGRAHPHDLGGRAIADYLRPQLQPGDRIWVWGWHLWDVYTYTATPSASVIYKSLGLLTPPNDDTWRGGGSPLRFVDGPRAKQLLDDFERTPPRFVVLGSTVPHREFAALRALLRDDYRRVRGPRIGKVQYWERRAD